MILISARTRICVYCTRIAREIWISIQNIYWKRVQYILHLPSAQMLFLCSNMSGKLIISGRFNSFIYSAVYIKPSRTLFTQKLFIEHNTIECGFSQKKKNITKFRTYTKKNYENKISPRAHNKIFVDLIVIGCGFEL